MRASRYLKNMEEKKMYAKITDGAVIRFFDLDNPASRANYRELVRENTGYSTVTENGNIKEFSEEQVKETLEKARKASGKKTVKPIVAANRAVEDEE